MKLQKQENREPRKVKVKLNRVWVLGCKMFIKLFAQCFMVCVGRWLDGESVARVPRPQCLAHVAGPCRPLVAAQQWIRSGGACDIKDLAHGLQPPPAGASVGPKRKGLPGSPLTKVLARGDPNS